MCSARGHRCQAGVDHVCMVRTVRIRTYLVIPVPWESRVFSDSSQWNPVGSPRGTGETRPAGRDAEELDNGV